MKLKHVQFEQFFGPTLETETSKQRILQANSRDDLVDIAEAYGVDTQWCKTKPEYVEAIIAHVHGDRPFRKIDARRLLEDMLTLDLYEHNQDPDHDLAEAIEGIKQTENLALEMAATKAFQAYRMSILAIASLIPLVKETEFSIPATDWMLTGDEDDA